MEQQNSDRILRMFARFTAVGYLAYLILLLPAIIGQADRMAAWWTPVALVLVFGPGITLGVVTFRRDARLTRRVAAVSAVTYAVVLAAVLPAWNGMSIPHDDSLWLAGFPGLAALAAVIAWPAPVAFGYMVVVAVAAQVSSFVIRENSDPYYLLPDIAFAIMFCAIFVGAAVMARRTGRLLDETSADTHANAAAAAAQRARLEERERFDGLIHDSVLATLRACANAQPRAEVRGLAADTLAELDGVRSEGVGPERAWDLTGAVAVLTGAAADLDPDARVTVVDAGGDADLHIPAEVVRALVAAQAEALRNSLWHAGPGATRSVRITRLDDGLSVQISDDGAGFDPAEVSPRRLGIAVSIRRRMARLPGGWAGVDSQPGAGTVVRIGWVRR